MSVTLLAAELIFVVYASWLQADFGATTQQLALEPSSHFMLMNHA